MIKKQDYTRKIDIPFVGEKEVNIPLLAGISIATLGTLFVVIPAFSEKSTAGEPHRGDGQTIVEEGKKYVIVKGDKVPVIENETVIPVEKPSIPLYSVVKGYVAACEPRSNMTATKRDWDTLAGLIEAPIKTKNYRGNGRYIANLAGEIIPQRDFINKKGIITTDELWDVKLLAGWIRQGNIWIEYTQYPMYYRDCQLWIPGINISPGETLRWNTFCQELGFEQLALEKKFFYNTESSHFYAKRQFPDFPYDRALTLTREKPSRAVFKTSDMVTGLQHIPYSPGYVYSMFALKIGDGLYFYSNTKNSPQDYATFILAVHHNLI